MTATSAGELVRMLQACRLLEPSHVEELQRTPQVLDVDVPTLTQCLVQLGWVTAYQVDQVLKGAGELLNLGPYRVQECLGEGALGATFKVQGANKKSAVLKIIRHDLLADPAVLDRWKEDVQLACKLLHPYLGQVREPQSIDGLHAYVRDFVDGADLASLVREKGPLKAPQACDVIRQAAQGLHRAHMEGLTHRHVQASNLIASGPQGQAIGSIKLVDLGIGILHEPRRAVRPTPRGTTRVADMDDVRLDLEGLGKTFQYLLTGNVDGGLPATVPADVQTIVRGMLGTGAERFRNLSDVARVLEPFCGTGAQAAADIPMATAVNPPPPAPPPPAPVPVPPPPPVVEAPPPPADVPTVPAGFFGESPEAEAIAASITREVSETVPVGDTATEAPTLPDAIQSAPPDHQPAPAAETQEESRYTREKQAKYGATFWVWATLGLLLHLVALGILIVVIVQWSNAEKNKKGGPKNRGEAPTISNHQIA